VQSALSNFTRPVDINESLLTSTKDKVLSRSLAILGAWTGGRLEKSCPDGIGMQAVVDEFNDERYVLAITLWVAFW
jgi:hypothetical protein